jgi:hypothetical protein
MARLLLCTGEPGCGGKCCGEHRPQHRKAAKRRARQIEKRQWKKEGQ